MPVDLRALVLPAFEGIAAAPLEGEVDPWRAAYDLDETTAVEGVPAPLYHGECGLGVVPTGIGKTAAATTTAAVCASDAVAVDEALVLSVGIAGAPPDIPLGSVVLADTVLDWDDKCRFDPDENEVPIATNPYTGEAGVFDSNPDLVSRARSLGADAALESVDAEPVLTVGTNVCADELWHGRTVAERVAWFVEERDRGPYRATEMEDSGTAAALERFGLGDRYLSVRGVSNHDRPDPGVSARASFFGPDSDADTESAFETGLENAVRVARTIVDDALE